MNAFACSPCKPIVTDTGATHQMSCDAAYRGPGHHASKQPITVANGSSINAATEGPIIWPTTASGRPYFVRDHGYFSTKLCSNLFAPIPLVDKGYSLLMPKWGKSASLITPEGLTINLQRRGNEWHLPPPPPQALLTPLLKPQRVITPAAELALRKEMTWHLWHGIL